MHLDQTLVELSAAAYTGEPTLRHGDCFAFISDIPGRTVIAFRGTNDWRSALQDAKAWPKRDADLGFCHGGFLEDARAIYPALRARMRGRRVVITGHSKGGADALIVGALLHLAGIAVTDIVTFGAPRAGFRRMRRILAPVQIRQYWAGDDPVPLVPWLLGCYVHMRDPFHLDVPWAIDPIDDHSDVRVYAKAVAALVPDDPLPSAA